MTTLIVSSLTRRWRESYGKSNTYHFRRRGIKQLTLIAENKKMKEFEF